MLPQPHEVIVSRYVRLESLKLPFPTVAFGSTLVKLSSEHDRHEIEPFAGDIELGYVGHPFLTW